MHKLILALGGSLAAFAFSGTASATTVIFSYNGTVQIGTDGIGLFGVAGADLSGLSYNTIFTVEYPVLGAIENTTATRNDYYGGGGFDTPSILTATLTINGQTISNAGNYRGQILKVNDENNLDRINSFVDGGFVFGMGNFRSSWNQNIFSTNNNIINSLAVTEAFNYNLTPQQDIGEGSFLYQNFNLGALVSSSQANFVIDNISVSLLAGAVPEPATWAFMIFGFGAVGGALRGRRKRSLTVSFS